MFYFAAALIGAFGILALEYFRFSLFFGRLSLRAASSSGSDFFAEFYVKIKRCEDSFQDMQEIFRIGSIDGLDLHSLAVKNMWYSLWSCRKKTNIYLTKHAIFFPMFFEWQINLLLGEILRGLERTNMTHKRRAHVVRSNSHEHPLFPQLIKPFSTFPAVVQYRTDYVVESTPFSAPAKKILIQILFWMVKRGLKRILAQCRSDEEERLSNLQAGSNWDEL